MPAKRSAQYGSRHLHVQNTSATTTRSFMVGRLLKEFNVAFVFVSDDMQWGLEKIATKVYIEKSFLLLIY